MNPDRAQFQDDLEMDLGALMIIDAARIEVLSMVGGSIIVTFLVNPDADGVALPIATLEEAFTGVVVLPLIAYSGSVEIISATVTAVKVANSTSTGALPAEEPGLRRLSALLRRLRQSGGGGETRQLKESSCAIIADPVSSYGAGVTAGSRQDAR